ncbi:Zinc finger protein [Quillaja saponaria]|uniref:Zinc finger protein n=1 Tax=Quillaja saponaria TaxID=32244 RepID=A0AAD7VEU0_QUISA|nr:Zinc finger protein [Quillaja saponaria]
MDDSCAVCAETLQWVAYGPCIHREVCSTCVVRLRFICNDNFCCLCKSISNVIFVTKALGDYTRMMHDFSVFPANPTEGQVGPYWYHEGTQAYFDDLDHYKMIKALCRLSCGVCEKLNGQKMKGTVRRAEFKNVEQLKSHMFHRHRLFMCSLCLEGRKIFVCEQKVYNNTQLNQHIKTGDSVIDGNECERGGFMGHPKCEFCQNPFYGDNELYLHMSTEHYTCHICQRKHPGQHEYYKDYDDLEIHFCQEHFLCEDETCLAKKFVVFATEYEMKRHNTLEHKGHMSRSQRNTVLQIPTSFRYQQSIEEAHRGRGYRPASLENQHSLAIQARAENICNTSSSQGVSHQVKASDIDSILNPFETLATLESEPSFRYSRPSGQCLRNESLGESSFPPLPVALRRIEKSRNGSEEIGGNTLAAHLHRRKTRTVTVLNSCQARPMTSHLPISSVSNSYQPRPSVDYGALPLSNSPYSSKRKPATVNGYLPSGPSNSAHVTVNAAHGFGSSDSASLSRRKHSGSTIKDRLSSSAPNLINRGSSENSNFPPMPVAQKNKLQSSSQPVLELEDVQTTNRSLVQKVRAALDFDESKFAGFKAICTEYRRCLVNTEEYLAHVHQFGLSHLILELARLCPDAQKQNELVETYKFNMSSDNFQSKTRNCSRKGKEKCEENGISSKNNLADDAICCMSNLQAKCKSSDKEMEFLPKDGQVSAKGKAKISVDVESNQFTFC